LDAAGLKNGGVYFRGLPSRNPGAAASGLALGRDKKMAVREGVPRVRNQEWGLVATSFVIVGLLRLGRFLHCPAYLVVCVAQKQMQYSYWNNLLNNYSATWLSGGH